MLRILALSLFRLITIEAELTYGIKPKLYYAAKLTQKSETRTSIRKILCPKLNLNMNKVIKLICMSFLNNSFNRHKRMQRITCLQYLKVNPFKYLRNYEIHAKKIFQGKKSCHKLRQQLMFSTPHETNYDLKIPPYYSNTEIINYTYGNILLQ